MRNLEAIEKDLAAARETLSRVEGTPAEVYSRIVGYYRSVRNWNRGKREEYGERKLYRLNVADVAGEAGDAGVTGIAGDRPGAAVSSPSFSNSTNLKGSSKELRLLLFIRAACPRCPQAKAAAGRLGIPLDLVNADTSEGMAEAAIRGVMSTPTAILVSGGIELRRAVDAENISRLVETEEPVCAERVAV